MRKCYFCGRTDWIETHHIFGGALRKKSDRYGFVINLCHWCHNEPPDGVHFNRKNNLILKRMAQRKFEETHSRDEFRRVFGKSYIMEDEE